MCKQYNQTTEECFYGDFVYFYRVKSFKEKTLLPVDNKYINGTLIWSVFSHTKHKNKITSEPPKSKVDNMNGSLFATYKDISTLCRYAQIK